MDPRSPRVGSARCDHRGRVGDAASPDPGDRCARCQRGCRRSGLMGQGPSQAMASSSIDTFRDDRQPVPTAPSASARRGSSAVRAPARTWAADSLRRMSADRATQRVVVADDDVLLREGVASLLERAGSDRGPGRRRRGAAALVRDQQPDLVIVDIRMPPTHDHRRARRGARDPAGATRRRDPRAVGARGGRAGDGAPGGGSGRRLSAEEPGHRVDDFIETVDRVIARRFGRRSCDRAGTRGGPPPRGPARRG